MATLSRIITPRIASAGAERLVGNLAFVNGRLQQGGRGSMMVLWAEPTRHLGLTHRQPTLHITPKSRVSAIRTLGAAEIYGRATSAKLVPRKAWGK